MSESLITDCEGDGTLPRSASRVVALLFLLVLGGAAAIDTLFPRREALPVGAELRALQRQERDANLADGSLARLFETKLRMRSRVRQTVVPWWSAFLLRTTGDALHSLVVGEDNVLLIRKRLEISSMEAEPLVETGARLVAAFERRLETAGTRLVVLPVPRKAAVCEDLLPRGTDGRSEVDRAQIARLEAGGMETVDLFDAWRDMEPLDVYLRYDSHWGPEGERAAARAIAELVGGQPTDALRLELAEDQRESCDLLRIAGVPPPSAAAHWLHSARKDRYRLAPPEADAAARDRSEWQDRVLVGTSFTQGHDVSLMLSHELGEIVWEQGYMARPFPEQLGRFLLELGDRPLPELIVWEFAVHLPLYDERGPGRDNRVAIGVVFALSPLVDGTTVVEALAESPDGAAPLAKRRGSRLLIPEGRIASTGDGVLGIRLGGEDLVGSRWRYVSRWMRYEFQWPPDRAEVVLPIVHAAGEAAAITLEALDGPEVLDRTEVSLEVTGAVQDLGAGSLDPRAGETGSSVELLDDPLQLPEHAALLLGASTERRAGEITVSARTSTGAERTWRLDCAPGGVVAISLQPLHGETLISIEVGTERGPKLLAGRSWRILAPQAP